MQAEVTAAKKKIPDLEQAARLEEKAHGAKLGALTQRFGAAQDGLEFLVERGTEPRAQLAEAQADLD